MAWWADHTSRYPRLSAADEITLGTAVRAWQDHPDGPDDCPPMVRRRGLRARNRIVEGNLKLAICFAGRFKTRAKNYDDLLQAANEGLITAANKFQPRKGYKFSTYAFFWVKRECDRWIQQREPILRPPTTAHYEAHRVRVFVRGYLAEHGAHPSVAEIAAGAEVRPERIGELRQWFRPMLSLDTPFSLDDGEADALGETIAAPAGHDALAAAVCADALAAMREADPDGAAVLELLTEAPVLMVADAAGMGRHQMRQVQRDALARLRELPQVRAALAAA